MLNIQYRLLLWGLPEYCKVAFSLLESAIILVCSMQNLTSERRWNGTSLSLENTLIALVDSVLIEPP